MTADDDRLSVTLGRGRVVQALIARFGVRRLLSDDDGTTAMGAELIVMDDDGDRHILVKLGETFPVMDQTWRLDEVRLVGDDYSVVISRDMS